MTNSPNDARSDDMNDTERPPDDRDDILDRNVAQLLTRAHEPPVMDATAKERVLDALRARAANKADKSRAHAEGGDADTPRADTQDADRAGRDEASVSDIRTRARRRTRARWLGAGVALAAAAAVIALWPGDAPTALRRVVVNDGVGPERIELADGSALILDRDAAITVTGPRRVTLDRGRALLDVSRGAGEFVVTTAHGRIVVLGTRFAVDARPDETIAAVIRGAVRVENDRGAETLRPGEQGTLRPDAAPTRRAAPRLSHLVGWARQARREGPNEAEPARRGTLLARDPQWQERDFPLPMRALTVDVHVQDRIARVALDQTFFNQRAEELEGVYRFALPPDAAVSRLAMFVDGKRMEAAIVERVRGRQIYESIVYRRRDPALLEWMQGNQLQVRIFPLRARQDKRIALSYTQPVEQLYDDFRLAVPIPEVDAPVDRVRFRVRLVDCGGCQVRSTSHDVQVAREGDDALVTFAADHHEIGDDLILTVRQPDTGTHVARLSGDGGRYAMIRARPAISADDAALTAATTATAAHKRRWVILADTSGSRSGLARRAQRHVAMRLVDEMDERDEVQVVAFDAAARTLLPAFTPVQDLALGELSDALAKQSADGVGYTDLGQALERAVALLQADDGDAADGDDGDGGDGGDGDEEAGAPYILYLGDGVVTGGERAPAALADLVRGRATVVSIAIGDAADASVLGALAAATGGVFTTMSPGDDLGWRCFDLIASLNTPRITDLTATLLDADGAPLDAVAYPSATALADGEWFSIVAKLGAREPAKLALSGAIASAGQTRPWRQTIELRDATARDGARYLPRLWAQRRVAALIADPTAALAADPPANAAADADNAAKADADKLDGDDDRLAKAQAAAKAEITALGTRHFLMTPHTSLLVLENDAMYRQYKVRRDRTPAWAPYPLPDEIEVITEPGSAPTQIANAIDPAAILVRSPLSLLATQTGYTWRNSRLRGRTIGWGPVAGAQEETVTADEGGALGRLTLATEASIRADAQLVSSPKNAADGFAEAKADITGGEWNAHQARVTSRELTRNPAAAQWMTMTTTTTPTVTGALAGPAKPQLIPDSSRSAESGWGRFGTIGTGSFDTIGHGSGTGSGYGVGSGGGGSSGLVGFRGVGHGRGGLRRHFTTAPQPMALHYYNDPRLDDLTEWVPALFEDGFDADARGLRRLRARAAAPAGHITSEARTLLDAARARQHAARYTGDAGTVTVDDRGRLALTRALPTGLVEHIVYDGDSLYHAYPELGLATRRPASDIAALIYDLFAPWRLPSADDLTRWYDVSVAGPRVLRLQLAVAPAGDDTDDDSAAAHARPAVDIALDDSLRVSEIRTVVGGETTIDLSIDYSDNGKDSGIQLSSGGASMTLRREPDTDAIHPITGLNAVAFQIAGADAAWTVVDMPTRQPAYHDDHIAAATAGSDAWRAAQVQRLAALAALGRHAELWKTLAALAEHGGARLGELALATAGVRAAPDRAALTRALAGLPGAHPLVRYARAVHANSRRPGAGRFDAIADAAPRSLVDMMAQYRALLIVMDLRDRIPDTLARLRRFGDDYAGTPLHYIGTWAASARWYWRSPKQLVVAWDALGGPWRPIAAAEAARVLYRSGNYEAAAARYERLLAGLGDDGNNDNGDGASAAPIIDREARWAFHYSSRGIAGWRLAWSAWRERMLSGDDPGRLLALLRAASLVGETDDLDRIAARVAQIKTRDPRVALALVDALAGAGRHALAWSVLAPWIEQAERAEQAEQAEQAAQAQRTDTSKADNDNAVALPIAMWQAASALAEQRARPADAARYLQRSLARRDGQPVPLAQVRADYARLIALHRQVALATAGDARDTAVTQALAAAAAWRRMDPANPDVDRAASSLLYALGRADQGWRYLSTVIERAPMQGDSYQIAAEVLEGEGQVERAEALWRRATEVDPTNPTWLLRQAQALRALGRTADARATIARVVGRKWHERFWNVPGQARALKKQLDADR